MTDHTELDLDDIGRPMAPAIGESEMILERVREMIAAARPMPLSSSVMINRDEIVDLLDEALDRMPDELRQARWMLKEREEYLEKVRREGDEILETARGQAERMVQRTEVVQEAKRQARRTVTEAEDEARQMIREAEDYLDQKLAGFEIVLERTLNTVRAGRDRLGITTTPEPEPDAEEGPDGPAVFDQDADGQW